MKLEPTKAQRKAMALALARRVGRESYVQGDLDVVWHQIEAANNIPEGAPVGTIARRPDGAAVAIRVQYDHDGFWGQSYWSYEPLNDPELFADDPDADQADSWPVIYDPTKPEQKTYPYAEGDTIVIGPECFQVPSKGAIAWKGVWYFDPDYQLNGFPPGEEPLVPRLDPTAQQEPVCSSVSDDYVSAHKPRTPRVVDRLGVDEQGSRWRGRGGAEYWFNGHRWCDDASPDGEFEYPKGYEPNMAYPYTEVLPDVG